MTFCTSLCQCYISAVSVPPWLARLSMILNQLPFLFMVLQPEWNNIKHLDVSKPKNVKAAPYKQASCKRKLGSIVDVK